VANLISSVLTLWWRKKKNVRKLLGRRQFRPVEKLCAFPIKGRNNHMILLEEKVVREDVDKSISDACSVGIIKVRDMISTEFIVAITDMVKMHVGYHERRSKKSRN
jgi:hypothetical protein